MRRTRPSQADSLAGGGGGRGQGRSNLLLTNVRSRCPGIDLDYRASSWGRRSWWEFRPGAGLTNIGQSWLLAISSRLAEGHHAVEEDEPVKRPVDTAVASHSASPIGAVRRMPGDPADVRLATAQRGHPDVTPALEELAICPPSRRPTRSTRWARWSPRRRPGAA